MKRLKRWRPKDKVRKEFLEQTDFLCAMLRDRTKDYLPAFNRWLELLGDDRAAERAYLRGSSHASI